MIQQIDYQSEGWDLVIIGGGATGLGCAVDAASRGLKTLLLEGRDYAAGTSSRSTKLIHGGVRYLAQGRIHLVREALLERARLLANAPHCVHPLRFVLPCRGIAERVYYATGLRAYDVLAGAQGIGTTEWLNADATRSALPNLGPGFAGGIAYMDAQFDDAALALSLLATFLELRGTALNYAPVKAIHHTRGPIDGLSFLDRETGLCHEVSAHSVINAAGVWGDAVRLLDAPDAAAHTRPSQGIHLVVDRRFMPGNEALLIPKTPDGRVLFVIPWQGKVILGTTDTPVDSPSDEPQASDSEIDLILETVAPYLAQAPSRCDVLAVYAGQRPLVAESGGASSALSREHAVDFSPSGLLTITGGKWTTYRRVAEDAVDALLERRREWRASQTATLRLRARVPAEAAGDAQNPWSLDVPTLTPASVRRDVLHEQARRIEDVLARRHRLLFLNAQQAIELAEPVGACMAHLLGWSNDALAAQVAEFRELARRYLVSLQ